MSIANLNGKLALKKLHLTPKGRLRLQFLANLQCPEGEISICE